MNSLGWYTLIIANIWGASVVPLVALPWVALSAYLFWMDWKNK